MDAGRDDSAEPADRPELGAELSDGVFARLVDHIVEDALLRLDRPHVVVVHAAGRPEFFGPFPTAIAAAVVVEAERKARQRQLDAEGSVDIVVFPLFDPACPHAGPATQ